MIAGTAARVAQEHRLQIDVEHLVPLLLGRLEEVVPGLDADVVVEDVEAAPARDRRLDHRAAVRRPRVTSAASAAASPPSARMSSTVSSRAREHLVDAEDARPLAREENRGRLAVPETGARGARARHDRHLPAEPVAHGPVPSAQCGRTTASQPQGGPWARMPTVSCGPSVKRITRGRRVGPGGANDEVP